MFRLLLILLALDTAAYSAAEDGNATRKYTVRAYECDQQNKHLSSEDRQRKIQGQPVRICLQPDENAQSDGISIDRVESWTWKTTFKGGEAKQTAVKEGKDDGILSYLSCPAGGKICILETVLTVNFYQNAGSVIGLGQVTLTSGAGTIDVQKDLFQTEFSFKFQQNPGSDEMYPEETQALLKLMAEKQIETNKLREQEAGRVAAASKGNAVDEL
ncbi:hypothetical protein IV203_005751 [Nitzschia inconspicua]|uniref:Secreted protein n=1 Tax=Nitzschia inconspicua TaxID=303405 RepID=A0A9K3KMX5_9STRA|nr:hypothetical protein IV203_005751 [Nitzschia inconspicua]